MKISSGSNMSKVLLFISRQKRPLKNPVKEYVLLGEKAFYRIDKRSIYNATLKAACMQERSQS